MIPLVIVSATAFVLGSLGLAAVALASLADANEVADANKVAAPSRPDVERPDDGGYRHVSPVVELDSRRRVPCPHYDDTFTAANLDGHLRFTCRVLAAKRAHPSSRTPGA